MAFPAFYQYTFVNPAYYAVKPWSSKYIAKIHQRVLRQKLLAETFWGRIKI